MAANVENIQFSSLNKGNSIPSEKWPKIRAKVKSNDSDDEGEAECEFEWKELIAKGNAELEPSILDPRDEWTADHWVERNPSLIRLTGKHPLNAEPPLTQLMHYGFITPARLHYVRSHGAVFKGSWCGWTVQVCGLVKRPAAFTMDQLVSEFPTREFPATLVCAGNRRKEQNMVKQTVGFHWGPGGISTSVWRGVPLWRVLERCGIMGRRKGAAYVCFEGAEDLPAGGGTKYGTSVHAEVAMDPSRDIILAYMQNGEVLLPDHGFPLRIIIPGFVGGRMVKWLKRIIVSSEESDCYHHYRDNRVLPSHVDAEQADSEGWWYKPEYIINELNVNSVITTPFHDEILPINSETTLRTYALRGYAYSGGGKKVTRLEVTIDCGETWRVCHVDRPEKPNKYGKYWCWCFWSLDVDVLDLLGAKEIAVRAWDESLSTQPEKLIWNVMGMMNNCWFRVKTHMCKPSKGEIGIRFEHPTRSANNPGGWMAREKHLQISSESTQTLKKSASTPFLNTASKTYSLSDLKKHNTPDSTWIVVHGHVYDCTRFLKDHPGGADSILLNAGTDCTEEFDAIHSDKAKKLLEDYRIGELSAAAADSADTAIIDGVGGLQHNHNLPVPPVHKNRSSSPYGGALVPRKKIQCRLSSKTAVSRDVRLFRFRLPSPDKPLGLPVGKHIFLCATVNGKLCMRAYTPTSAVDEVGYFDLVVRIYFKDEHLDFPKGGIMSQFLDSLPVGSTVDVKGPTGHIEYAGRGNFAVHEKRKYAKRLAMVAGGTGITPIYQVIQAIVRDPQDETEIHLVYACRTEEDILLREELDELAEARGGGKWLKVWYVVESCVRAKQWKYGLGFVTEGILRERLPEAAEETLALACGLPAMIRIAVAPNLEKMGYDVKESLLVF